MIRVAFTAIGGRKWTGGRNYLVNLLMVLARYELARLTPVLFLGTDEDPAELARFEALPGLEVVRAPAFDSVHGPVALANSMLLGRDLAAARQFRHHRIDIVFESARFFGWRLGLPAIAWLPDFQHRDLPRLFPLRVRLRRELGFRAQIAAGRTIMLSSENARHRCEAVFPATKGRAFAIPFAMAPAVAVPLEEARRITRGLGLNEPYFFLPNQFWKHKNHWLVAEAMALLRQRGRRVKVYATGEQSDPRNPGHFPALMRRIAQLGLSDDLVLPGLVPYGHVRALLRTCQALINPSLFEGWSTTVEEARVLGTPMLLSDLAVHREQMGEGARYFDRHSPASLADCMEGFASPDEAAREAAFLRAQAEADVRARAYAASFTRLVLRCMQ